MLVMSIEFHFKFVERNLNVVGSLERRLIQSLILVYSSNLSTHRNSKCIVIRFIDRKKNLYKNVHFLIPSLKLIIIYILYMDPSCYFYAFSYSDIKDRVIFIISLIHWKSDVTKKSKAFKITSSLKIFVSFYNVL